MSYTTAAHTTFRELSGIVGSLGELRTIDSKEQVLSRYFKGLDKPDLKQALIFLMEGPFPKLENKRIQLGSRTLTQATIDYCDIDFEKVYQPCRKAVGNTTETVKLLLQNVPNENSSISKKTLTLQKIHDFLEELSKAKTSKQKKKILVDVWDHLESIEIPCFLSLLSNKPLISESEMFINNSLSIVLDKQTEVIREKVMISGSHSLAIENLLSEQPTRYDTELNQPLPFMRAYAAEKESLSFAPEVVAEELLPGIRAQLLYKNGRAQLFNRNGRNISSYFPDVVEYYQNRMNETVLLDGQLILLKKNEICSTEMLIYKRLSGKPTSEIIKNDPVLFIPFDVLYHENELLFKKKFDVRRDRLLSIREQTTIPLIKSDINIEMDHNNGMRGLIIKNKNAVYQPGVRSKNWLKVYYQKYQYTVVLLYLHRNSGKTGFSHFTLGVRTGTNSPYPENYVPIGKISIEQKILEDHRILDTLQDLVVEKFGPTLALSPELILHIESKAITPNNRTKAKFQITDPTLICFDSEAPFESITTIDEIRESYFGNLNRKRKVTNVDTPFYI